MDNMNVGSRLTSRLTVRHTTVYSVAMCCHMWPHSCVACVCCHILPHVASLLRILPYVVPHSCVAHTAVRSVAMLPYLLFVDACSTDDPVPAPPTWPSAWNCTCTAPMTDGLKLPGCALRCHIRRRGRTCVHAQRCGRTCFLRQVNQQEGKKR